MTNLSSKFEWQFKDDARSRGTLIYEFVKSEFYQSHPDWTEESAANFYLEQVSKNLKEFNGFNLIAGNLKSDNPEFWYLDYLTGELSNIGKDQWVGLSNSPLHQPYVKTLHGISLLQSASEPETLSEIEAILSATLNDNTSPKPHYAQTEDQIFVAPYWSVKNPAEWLRGTQSQIILTVDIEGVFKIHEVFYTLNFPRVSLESIQAKLKASLIKGEIFSSQSMALKKLQGIVCRAVSMLRFKKMNI